MNPKPAPPSSPGMTLGDIYYILFRHKWKIIIISLLGLAVALTLPFFMPSLYQSDAKLFIRYVVENQSPARVEGSDSQTRTPDQKGGAIIGTETEILNSLDLSQQVADVVGPERILADVGGGTNRQQAAGVIRKGLTVTVSKESSSVIALTFKHPNPNIVQPVLNELIETYFRRHSAIHRAVGVFEDFLNQETLQLRNRLVDTENALRVAKTNAGIISLEDSKQAYSQQHAAIRADIYATHAQLAERRAAFEETAKLVNGTNSVTDVIESPIEEVPSERMTEYRQVSSLLETLFAQEIELSLRYTPEHAQIKGVRERIAATQKAKEQLEKEYPGLLTAVVSLGRSGQRINAQPTPIDLRIESIRINALVSKLSVLTNQLVQLRQDANAVNSVEGVITELQRKRELEEANYKYFSAKLEQSRIDEALGAGRISNISKIQEPTPPFPDDEKLNKIRAGAFFGAIGFALALAFLIEMVLDRSIRRPREIRDFLQIPLFLSIPRLKLNGKVRSLKPADGVPLLADGSDATKDGEKGGEGSNGESHTLTAAGAWDGRLELRPFYETLRDRLIVFFEMKNLHHKPKLVAVTSCGEGAGVTTTAAGLAATLSETGEGNVLLVDMNAQQGEAHHYYKGRLDCGIDDVLEGGKRDNALVQENLYVVTEGSKNDKLPQVLPKRFKHLIPRLRASDYDYIIFDMPPVSQISPTPRLAQFMDMVFLVVESEKTDRDLVKHAAALLAESKANVGVVLNKSKAYVPRRLQHDL